MRIPKSIRYTIGNHKTLSSKTEESLSEVAKYPTLLRRGHKYELSLGQRLPVEGFHGPLDVAIGPDEWMYVVNRWDRPREVPRNRYVTVTMEDEYGEFIFPKIADSILPGRVKNKVGFVNDVRDSGHTNKKRVRIFRYINKEI